jgi:hypothetical protein
VVHEPLVDLMVCTKKFYFGPILVEDVEYYNICMAVVQCNEEAASLISEEVSIGFIDGHEDKVSAGIVGFLRDILHRVVKAVGNLKWHGSWSGLSDFDSLALLIHVSHIRFCGD